MRGSKDPKWLRPLWEKKKADIASRVDRAVKQLVRLDKGTFESIRTTVKSLFGVSISANTIQRNEKAYAVYLRYRTTRRTSKAAERGLARRLRKASGAAAVNLRARINSLRRESKDNLIERLLQREEEIRNQAAREEALREEIFRLHPAARKTRT